MNRTTAIVLTVVSSLLCGLPGIALMCLTALGVLGTNTPGFYEQNPGSTPEQTWLGAGFLVCMSLLLLIIPVIVGVLSFRISKPAEPGINGPMPPAY